MEGLTGATNIRDQTSDIRGRIPGLAIDEVPKPRTKGAELEDVRQGDDGSQLIEYSKGKPLGAAPGPVCTLHVQAQRCPRGYNL
jgi:hypothetical protein